MIPCTAFGFVLLALPAFLPSVVFLFLSKIRADPCADPGLSPGSTSAFLLVLNYLLSFTDISPLTK